MCVCVFLSISVILSHGNSTTAQGEKLYNMITHAYVPQECVAKILSVDDTGQKLYEDYVSERIIGEVSLWAPVRKENNKMFMSGNKKETIKIRDKTVDLKETKDLYGRLLVLVRSNRQIDQKHAISNYKFTVTTRALFAASGAVLSCTNKSKLIHLLESLPTADTSEQDSPRAARGVLHAENLETTSTECVHLSHKIAPVDGMVVIQKLTKKPTTVVTVKVFRE